MEAIIVLLYLTCVTMAEFSDKLSHPEVYDHENMFIPKKRYRPLFHITAPMGWLNSPSGFTFFKNRYHIFYQYHPYSGAWDALHWGQATSSDLTDWVHYPPALIPKDLYDRHGCLSGTALVHKQYLTVFYTGNVLSKNRTTNTQNVAVSSNGIVFQKYLYNPLIRASPKKGSIKQFRNPKVWEFRNNWYMFVGGSSNAQLGQLDLYTSKDLFSWKYNKTVGKSYGEMGFMWENPDFFEVDGHHILILSVRGIMSDCARFRSSYQTGYFIGHFNYNTLKFENLEVSLATFNELDFGHDFYAAQTMRSQDGRRLLVGWLGQWETDTLESKDGWASMLSIVREVRLNLDGRLLTTPVREMENLRTENLENAWYNPGESFLVGSRSFEMIVNATSANYDTSLSFDWNGESQYVIVYTAGRARITVKRGVEEERQADWLPNSHLHFHIFVDSSSIEVFCGEGEIVFSSRIYPTKGLAITVGGEMQLYIVIYRLRKNVGYDKKLQNYLKANYVRSRI